MRRLLWPFVEEYQYHPVILFLFQMLTAAIFVFVVITQFPNKPESHDILLMLNGFLALSFLPKIIISIFAAYAVGLRSTDARLLKSLPLAGVLLIGAAINFWLARSGHSQANTLAVTASFWFVLAIILDGLLLKGLRGILGR